MSDPILNPSISLRAHIPKNISDNKESTQNDNLTLIAEFDNLIKFVHMKYNEMDEDVFMNVVKIANKQQKLLSAAKEECVRLQNLLTTKSQELSDLESKLYHARKLLDKEKKQSRRMTEEKNILAVRIEQVREFLFKEQEIKWTNKDKEKLSFLYNGDQDYNSNNEDTKRPLFNKVLEINSTGSLLSDFNYSVSEDDLQISLNCSNAWKKHRASSVMLQVPSHKKRRSSENHNVMITNIDSTGRIATFASPKCGPLSKTSITEESVSQILDEGDGLPNHSEKCLSNICDERQNNVHEVQKQTMRQHNLQAKIIVMPDICGPCEKRISFGKMSLKCKDCRTSCHAECKNNLSLPCVPYVCTPTQKNVLNLIGDYAPTSPPMIPALIVHSLREIESRGLNEIGLYRIPGSEREVKQLKEKFLKGKGCPSLTQVDINVICGTVKDFLRNLQEPLVTLALRPKFIECVESKEDNSSIQAGVYKIISELPQPNRDTMAYLVLHLIRVSKSECKMPVGNLAMVFGPTIVGFSALDLESSLLLAETRQQLIVVEYLMNLPLDYWSTFINIQEQDKVGLLKLQQTPSTDSLMRKFPFVHSSEYHQRRTKCKKKFFPTLPN